MTIQFFKYAPSQHSILTCCWLAAQLFLLGFQTTHAKQPTWKQIWQDEFTGTELSEKKWEIFVGSKPHNNEQQAYIASRVHVADGNLVLTADDTPHEGKPYSSGKVVSRWAQQYGRWEVRAKLPSTRGTWPAIWILPDWRKHPWPSQGEIDIMENRGDKPFQVSSAFHYGSRQPYKHDFKYKPYSKQVEGKPVNYHADFHVYAAEWEKREIRFFVDGENFWTLRDEDVDGFLSQQTAPMQVILNLAIGGDFVKQAQPDETSVWPQRMLVDYVRVYERKASLEASKEGQRDKEEESRKAGS